jgi:predicted Zn-dependent protease
MIALLTSRCGLTRSLRRVGSLVLLVCAALPAGGCNPPTGDGGGPGHRQQYLGLSPQEEYALGVKAYRQILDEARQKDALLPEGSPSVRRVREVGERIAETTRNGLLLREINLHLKGYRFDWEFNVIRSREINAFCLPGGKVAVYTGLLRIVENDDQLATVLSHEIAHALAHHSNERVTREESGRVSWLMTFAGYDPDEALEFWQRMQRAQRGGQPPEILSNHPSDARRIQQLRAWLPQAKAAKVAYDHHQTVPSR